jgi:hypothetical protein
MLVEIVLADHLAYNQPVVAVVPMQQVLLVFLAVAAMVVQVYLFQQDGIQEDHI